MFAKLIDEFAEKVITNGFAHARKPMKSTYKLLLALSTALTCCGSPASCQRLSFEQFSNSFLQQHGIPVVNDESTLSAAQIGNRNFALSGQRHETLGDAYVVITDLNDNIRKQALIKLANFHHGSIIQIRDLGALENDASARASLRTKLLKLKPRFVAIAPRPENYRENVQLALLSLFAQLDKSGQIAVYPGWLTAPDDPSFVKLLQHSYNSKSYDRSTLKPMIFAQVPGPRRGGTRSVSKAALLQPFFKTLGCDASVCILKTDAAVKAGLQTPVFDAQGAVIKIDSPRMSILPKTQVAQFSNSNLVLLFGHGVPGMTCSMGVDAFDSLSFNNKIVLCGSCFSAAPGRSDFNPPSSVNDATYLSKSNEIFADRAIANGATLFYGQMVTNQGFPELWVVFSNLMQGRSAGEAYQRLLNNRIIASKFSPEQLILPPESKSNQSEKDKRSELLYVLIGDPALCPLSVEIPR